MAKYDQQIQQATDELYSLLQNQFSSFSQKQSALNETARILSKVPKEEWLKNQQLVDLIWAVIDQDMSLRFNFEDNTLPRLSEGENGESTNNHNNLLEHCLVLGLLPDRGSSNHQTETSCNRYVAERAQREFAELRNAGLERVSDENEFYARSLEQVQNIVRSGAVADAVLALHQPSNQVRDKVLELIQENNNLLLLNPNIIESLTVEEVQKLKSSNSSNEVYYYPVFQHNMQKAFYKRAAAADPDHAALSMLDYMMNDFNNKYHSEMSSLERAAKEESLTLSSNESISRYLSVLFAVQQADIYPSLANASKRYEVILPKTLDSLMPEELLAFLSSPSNYPWLEKEWNGLSQEQFDRLIAQSFFFEGYTNQLFKAAFSAAPMAHIMGSAYASNFGTVIQSLGTDDTLQQRYAQKVDDENRSNTRIATAAFFAKHLDTEQLHTVFRRNQPTLMKQIIHEAKSSQDYQKLMEVFFQADEGKRNAFLGELFNSSAQNSSKDVKKVLALLAYFAKFEANIPNNVSEEIIATYERAKISAIEYMIVYVCSKNLANAVLYAFSDTNGLEQNGLSRHWVHNILNVLKTLVAAHEYQLADLLYTELFAKNAGSSFITLPTNGWASPVLERNAESQEAIQQNTNNAIVAIYLEAMLLSVSKQAGPHHLRDTAKFVNLLPYLPEDFKQNAVYKKVLNSTVTQTWETILRQKSLEQAKTMAQAELPILLKEINKYPASDQRMPKFFQTPKERISNAQLFELSQYKKFYHHIEQAILLQKDAFNGPESLAELVENVNELKRLIQWMGYEDISEIASFVVEILHYGQIMQAEVFSSIGAMRQLLTEKENAHKQKLTTALTALEQYTNKQDSVRRTDGHRAKRLAHIEQMFDAAQKNNNEEAFNQLRANPPKVELMGISLGSGMGSFHTYLPALDYTTWHYFKDDREVQDLVGRILGKQELIKEKQKQQDIAEVSAVINTKLGKLEAQLTRQESAEKVIVSEAGIEASVLASWESLVANAPSYSGSLSNPFVGEAKAEKFAATWAANKPAIKENTNVEARVAELKRRSDGLVQRAREEETAALGQKTKQRQEESSEIYQKIEAYLLKVRDGQQNISSKAFEERAGWFAKLREVCPNPLERNSLVDKFKEIEAHFKQMPSLGVTSELGGYFKRLTPHAVCMDWSSEQVGALATLAETALEQLQQREQDAAKTAEQAMRTRTEEAQRAKEEKKAAAERMKQEKAAQAQERVKTDAVDYTTKLIDGLDSELATKNALPPEDLRKLDTRKLEQRIEQLSRFFKGKTQERSVDAESVDEAGPSSEAESSAAASNRTMFFSRNASLITSAMQDYAEIIHAQEGIMDRVANLVTQLNELKVKIEQAKANNVMQSAGVGQGHSVNFDAAFYGDDDGEADAYQNDLTRGLFGL